METRVCETIALEANSMILCVCLQWRPENVFEVD